MCLSANYESSLSFARFWYLFCLPNQVTKLYNIKQIAITLQEPHSSIMFIRCPYSHKLVFCGHCGSEMADNHKFCPSCGKAAANPASDNITDSTGKSIKAETPEIEEKMFFSGEGEIIVKKIEHRGTGRKIGSWLVGGPIGYLAFGRDKTQKSKAKGRLVVTQKTIYCAGNEYPFDKILSLARIGTMHKSLLINFQSDVAGQRYDIKLEIRTKEMDRLFVALESARMSKIGF